MAVERGKFDEIKRMVVQARAALGALVYGGQSGDVPLALMASAGQCYYGLSVASESFDRLMALLGDAVPAREAVLLIEAQDVAVEAAPAPARGNRVPVKKRKAAAAVERHTSAEREASHARGGAKAVAAGSGSARRGVLEEVVRAALETTVLGMSNKEICVWAMKHRAHAVQKYRNLGSNTYAMLRRLMESHVVEDGDRDGLVVYTLK